MTDIRPMRPEDVDGCEVVWHDAYPDMRARFNLPVVVVGDPERARQRRHVALALDTDPGGSWVAVSDDAVVGFAQALQRESLWVLALLGVSVAHQGRGVARRLLERALDYGEPHGPGLIMSSRDPKAVHRYVQAGFALFPAVAAVGVVRRSKLLRTDEVRPGEPSDRALVEGVDRHLRGASHGPELDLLLEEGCRLLVVPGHGYALVRSSGVAMLGADDEEPARHLLAAGLAATPEGATVDVNWITGAQQWAIRLCTDLGLELHPGGGVMVRGTPGPLTPYIPSGAFS